jgi:hypothetical protein
MMPSSCFRGLALVSCLMATTPSLQAQTPASDNFSDKLISLGTASESGTFYQIGKKLCEVINRDRRDKVLRCIAYRSAGSEYNMKAVEFGDLTIAIARSDNAFNEYNNRATDSEINGESLRAVMSLHRMPVTIIARRAANIINLQDIAGHAINLGNLGSGQRSSAEFLLKTLNLKTKDFSSTTDLNTTDAGNAFCNGDIDVIIETLGNPSPFYRRMIEQCNGNIVRIPASLIDPVIATNPMIERQTIPGGLYAGHPEPIPTFGYKAILVASKYTHDESISRFISSVVNHLAELREAVPALEDLDLTTMFHDGIAIPLHDGVVQYRKSH